MKQRRDPSTALEVIQRTAHLIQKERKNLSSSQLRVLLSDCIQALKDSEKRLSQSITVVKAGLEFGPIVKFHSQTRQLVIDLRTKLWLRLRRKYDVRCKSRTSGKELEKI